MIRLVKSHFNRSSSWTKLSPRGVQGNRRGGDKGGIMSVFPLVCFVSPLLNDAFGLWMWWAADRSKTGLRQKPTRGNWIGVIDHTSLMWLLCSSAFHPPLISCFQPNLLKYGRCAASFWLFSLKAEYEFMAQWDDWLILQIMWLGKCIFSCIYKPSPCPTHTHPTTPHPGRHVRAHTHTHKLVNIFASKIINNRSSHSFAGWLCFG